MLNKCLLDWIDYINKYKQMESEQAIVKRMPQKEIITVEIWGPHCNYDRDGETSSFLVLWVSQLETTKEQWN